MVGGSAGVGLSWGGALLGVPPGAKRRANNIQVLLVTKEGSASEKRFRSRSSMCLEAELSSGACRDILPCPLSFEHLYRPQPTEGEIEAPRKEPRPAPLLHEDPVCNKMLTLCVPALQYSITYEVRRYY